jgi:hypothetical protein
VYQIQSAKCRCAIVPKMLWCEMPVGLSSSPAGSARTASISSRDAQLL